MKFLLVLLLLIQTIAISYQDESINIDSDEESDIMTDTEAIPGETSDEQELITQYAAQPMRCSRSKYRRYRKQLWKIQIKSLPYNIRLKTSRRRRKYIGRCYKRSPRRSSSGLYNLCNPCYRKVEIVIHPALNMVLSYNQANCNTARCLRFGHFALGRCEPFYYTIPLPIPDMVCNRLVYKTFKLLVGCACKSYRPLHF